MLIFRHGFGRIYDIKTPVTKNSTLKTLNQTIIIFCIILM